MHYFSSVTILLKQCTHTHVRLFLQSLGCFAPATYPGGV